MFDGPHTTDNEDKDLLSMPALIGQGTQGTVHKLPETPLVQKRFQSENPDDAARLARWEFHYLKRLTQVLARQPYVHCPEPVKLEPENGSVTMSHVQGAPLSELIAYGDDSSLESHLDHIAEHIAVAIEDYVGEFSEPFYSIGLHNMLYEPSTRILSLVDFTSSSRDRSHDFSPDSNPIAISLGILIGRSMFPTSGPRGSRDEFLWNRIRRLMSIASQSLRERNNLDVLVVHRVSTRTYLALARKIPLRKRVWYLTIGLLLFLWRRQSIGIEGAIQRGGDSTMALAAIGFPVTCLSLIAIV